MGTSGGFGFPTALRVVGGLTHYGFAHKNTSDILAGKEIVQRFNTAGSWPNTTYPPACPVFDGISAAEGKVVVGLVNGHVLCLHAVRKQP